MKERCNTPTEVYSRVVGYFRPVQNWNPGKQEEFRQRKTYLPAPRTVSQPEARQAGVMDRRVG